MPLEATFLCLDNSEYMRNSDLLPSRLGAVYDACNIVCGAKTQQNPENTLGVLTMGGKMCEIRESLTQHLPRLYAALAGIHVGGSLRFVEGVQIAALGLKHRQNKQQRQRLVCFVGSPILESDKELETLGKQLKKSSVAIDIITFGCEENNEKLKALVDNANSSDNSHFISVPVGVTSLADILMSSPIVAGEDGVPPVALAGAGGDFEFADDPELAMALRLSMEEERRRQEQANQAEGGGDGSSGSGGGSGQGAAPMEGMSDEDQMLALALKMSMEESAAGAAAAEDSNSGGGSGGGAGTKKEEDKKGKSAEPQQQGGGDTNMDDDAAALELALKMSVEGQQFQDGVDELMNDSNFMDQLAKDVQKKEEDDKNKK